MRRSRFGARIRLRPMVWQRRWREKLAAPFRGRLTSGLLRRRILAHRPVHLPVLRRELEAAVFDLGPAERDLHSGPRRLLWNVPNQVLV